MTQVKKNRTDTVNVKLPETLQSKRPMDERESDAFINATDWSKIYPAVAVLVFLRQPVTLARITPTIAAKLLEGFSFFGDGSPINPPLSTTGFWDGVMARVASEPQYEERIKHYYLLATKLTNDLLKRMKEK